MEEGECLTDDSINKNPSSDRQNTKRCQTSAIDGSLESCSTGSGDGTSFDRKRIRNDCNDDQRNRLSSNEISETNTSSTSAAKSPIHPKDDGSVEDVVMNISDNIESPLQPNNDDIDLNTTDSNNDNNNKDSSSSSSLNNNNDSADTYTGFNEGSNEDDDDDDENDNNDAIEDGEDDDSSDASTSFGGGMDDEVGLEIPDDSSCDGSSSLITSSDSQSLSNSDDESGTDVKIRKDYSKITETQNEILGKPKPKYMWNAVPDLFYRELGLTGRRKKFIVGRNSEMFHYRLSGSLYTVERLELMAKMEHHTGCVNSLHFNKSGSLIVSGSDDLQIILWKWSTNKIFYKYDSGHNSNVFQTKFLDLGGSINIISSARDGQVLRAEVPSSGGQPIITTLVKHASPVHKLALPPTSPFEVLTAGEDGRVFRYDFRENIYEKLISVKANLKRIPLYSIAAHPIDEEFCVCGRDQYVRVYDKRNLKEPVKKLAPKHLLSKRPYSTHITCAVYNYIGTEILASYSDDDIFLFENKVDDKGNYLHKYQGHNNTSTIKGVNFFGPRSEFVMSGSDCANCFFWDKNTEAIVQWMPGDETGVVNCLEPHPSFPILATSGMDHDIKIWVPSCEFPPNLLDLRKCIHKNLQSKQKTFGSLNIFDDQTINLFVRHCLRTRRRNNYLHLENPDGFQLSDDDDDDDDDDAMDSDRFRGLPCSPS